jgi:hypothetical protein
VLRLQAQSPEVPAMPEVPDPAPSKKKHVYF